MSAARKLEQIGPLPKLRAEEFEFRVGAAQPNPSEVGPLYKAAYRTSRTQGLRVATALAKTLPDIDHHRQLFQAVALRPAKERRTLIDGYRKAEQDRWVVHAIGELPSAQGRSLMKDFVLTETGKKDQKALREVALYVAELGATIVTRPVDDDQNDAAIVEAIGDLVDALKQAVDAVVSARSESSARSRRSSSPPSTSRPPRWRTSPRRYSPRADRSSTSCRARSRRQSRTRWRS